MASHGRQAAATPLTIGVDESDPDAPELQVGGDLAFTTAAPLRDAVDRLLSDNPRAIVFDFGGLQFIDSTGLSVIVHAWREGQQKGTVVHLRSTPRFLETILDMTGVTGLLARPLPGGLSDVAAASTASRSTGSA